MPFQEERTSGKPAAKARPILKPSPTSNWNFVPDGTKEDGLTLKYKIPKIHVTSQCRNSSRIYYDTKMLDAKEMQEFLIVELLK